MLIDAVVIKKMHFREHDQLVTLYSRQLGKLAVLAKGAMRAHSVQALQIDPGNMIHCELVPGKAGLPIMTGAQSVRCFSHMKTLPKRTAAVLFFLQVIDAVVYEQEPDEDLWTSLTETISYFDTVGDVQLMKAFRERQGDLLRVMGYGNDYIADSSGHAPVRAAMDDFFEQLANRRMKSLDLFFELAAG